MDAPDAAAVLSVGPPTPGGYICNLQQAPAQSVRRADLPEPARIYRLASLRLDAQVILKHGGDSSGDLREIEDEIAELEAARKKRPRQIRGTNK